MLPSMGSGQEISPLPLGANFLTRAAGWSHPAGAEGESGALTTPEGTAGRLAAA